MENADNASVGTIRSWWARASRTAIGDIAATALVALGMFAASAIVVAAFGVLVSLVR